VQQLLEGRERLRETAKPGGTPLSGEAADPLVVIDGMRVGRMSTARLETMLAPDRIARIDVLKGESAVVRYGEEGRNGVIVVHAKEGGTTAPRARQAEAEAKKAEMDDQKARQAHASAMRKSSGPAPIAEEGKVFEDADPAPAFPGGPEVMKDYLRSRLTHDPEVQSDRRSFRGRCQLSVTVEADGRLGYFSIASAKSGNARLADKLADYLRQGPVWTPGRRNGKAVRTLHRFAFSY
jgi:hypothetical protein